MANSTASLSQVFGNTDNAVMTDYTFNYDNTKHPRSLLPPNLAPFSRDAKRIHANHEATILLNSCLPLDLCMPFASANVNAGTTLIYDN